MKAILQWSVNRIHKLEDLFTKDLDFIWFIPKTDETIDEKQLIVIGNLKNVLLHKDELSKQSLPAFLKTFAKENDIKYSVLMKTLRSVLSGLKVRVLKISLVILEKLKYGTV